MKTKSLILLCAGLILGIVLSGCNKKSSQKMEDAKENLNEAKIDIKEAVHIEKMAVTDTLSADWNNFEAEMQDQIRKNEKSIKEFKEKSVGIKDSLKTKINGEIEKLEQKNSSLKTKLKKYKTEGKEKETAFKKEFKHDMDELGAALKDLFVKNVK